MNRLLEHVVFKVHFFILFRLLFSPNILTGLQTYLNIGFLRVFAGFYFFYKELNSLKFHAKILIGIWCISVYSILFPYYREKNTKWFNSSQNVSIKTILKYVTGVTTVNYLVQKGHGNVYGLFTVSLKIYQLLPMDIY